MLDHLKETDHGTPLRVSEREVTLEIDGMQVTVPEGTSLMRAAVDAGVRVPKLCATDSLEPFGSCRLCLVEVEGRKGFPASCTTPAEAGMKVRTQSPRLQELRKGVMELYISDHPLDCLTCSANGNCELQDMAGVTGLREVRYGLDGANHFRGDSKPAVDDSNPYFSYDASKCIVCNRCVRACEETQGTFALTIQGRGFESRVSPGQGQSFMDSECVSCGACVEACPTATLQEKSIIQLGQPEHSTITTCAYCGVGCGFKAEMKGNEVVRMVPWKDGKANEGHACCASWSMALAVAPPRAGRSRPSRSVARWGPMCPKTNGMSRSTTRPMPPSVAWWAMAASWCTTTPPTWPGWRAMRWISVRSNRAANARPAASVRPGVSR